MQFLPSRRWFQFRLSTAFVLVGIGCWMLACRPYVVSIFGEMPFEDDGKLYYAVGDHPMLNPALLWPGLVLAAFVGWKARSTVARFQEWRRAASPRERPQRGWYWFRIIGTWLFLAWLFVVAVHCRPYVVTMVGREVPPSDENPFPFLVGEQRFLNPGLARSMLVLAAFLGWKAVGAAERLKSAIALNRATEIPGN
ncbi:MAG: hypothetical protein AB7U73_19305 [Pirellulales bacterium]